MINVININVTRLMPSEMKLLAPSLNPNLDNMFSRNKMYLLNIINYLIIYLDLMV